MKRSLVYLAVRAAVEPVVGVQRGALIADGFPFAWSLPSQKYEFVRYGQTLAFEPATGEWVPSEPPPEMKRQLRSN